MPLPKRILVFDGLLLVCCFAAIWFGDGKNMAAAITIPYAPETIEASVVASSGAKKRKTEKPEKPSAEDLAVALSSKRRLASSVLIPARPDTMPFVPFEPQMLQAMYEQVKFLYRKDVPKIGASGITKAEMLETVERLQDVQLLDPRILFETFDFYRINTEFKKDRVRLTGYYLSLIHI